MKKQGRYFLIMGVLLLVNLSAFAGDFFNHSGDCSGGGQTAAPLDGGLLSILAVAGVTYFTARKKMKNKE